MDLIDHLENFKAAMDTYHDLLVAEAEGVGDYQYLKIGAGLRLPEKPRKNVERLQSALEALLNDEPTQARTWLRAVYGSWRDHIGLHDTYIDTNQMSVAHVLSHFGGHLTEEHFSVSHTEVVREILNKMNLAQHTPPLPVAPNAWSLGVALCEALKEVEMLIAG